MHNQETPESGGAAPVMPTDPWVESLLREFRWQRPAATQEEKQLLGTAMADFLPEVPIPVLLLATKAVAKAGAVTSELITSEVQRHHAAHQVRRDSQLPWRHPSLR